MPVGVTKFPGQIPATGSALREGPAFKVLLQKCIYPEESPTVCYHHRNRNMRKRTCIGFVIRGLVLTDFRKAGEVGHGGFEVGI